MCTPVLIKYGSTLLGVSVMIFAQTMSLQSQEVSRHSGTTSDVGPYQLMSKSGAMCESGLDKLRTFIEQRTWVHK